MKNLEFADRLLSEEAWTPTPLLHAATIGSRLSLDLWLKREDCTPVGSFKIRGGLVSMAVLGQGLSEEGVYVASAGNYGLAIALAGQRVGVKVTVMVPVGATPSKIEKMRLCGATVIEHGEDFDAAKQFARARASEAGTAFWEDGVIEEMALGAATIGTELLEHPEPWDYVIVPIGNGSLMKGIASVFRDRSPDTRIVGPVPSATPAMYHAIKGQSWDEGASADTSADGLSVRVVIPGIVEELMSLVDDLWLVEEHKLLPSVRSLMELEQVMVEPSAAISIAGLVDHRAELQGKRVAVVLTGAHLRQSLFQEIATVEGIV